MAPQTAGHRLSSLDSRSYVLTYLGPYIGPYFGPYFGPYLAALFCSVGCPILQCGMPYMGANKGS